jgi:two-component system response regulator
MVEILVVDDSAEDRALAQRVLKQCKILNPTQMLRSGEECIRKLETGIAPGSDWSGLRFLVLLDLSMSPHNGHWVLREAAKRNLKNKAIFVMLSGIAGIRDVHEGYQLGAKTFLIKPLKAEDILELINALRGKLRLEELAAGYQLHWMEQEAHGIMSSGTDTTFMMKRGSPPAANN